MSPPPERYMTVVTPVAAIFVTIAWLAVLLRCYVRIAMVKKFGWDDAFMVMTMILFSGFSGLLIEIDRTTGCQNVIYLPWSVVWEEINPVLAALLMYIVTAFMLKVSLGLLLLRVTVKTWMMVVTYITMAIPVAYGTFYFFFVLFQCGNPKRFRHLILQQHCLAPSVIDGTCYLHTSLNAIADWVFCILPIFIVREANVNRRQKIGIAIILGFGSVGSVVSVIRFGWISELATPGPDFLPQVKMLAVLSEIELGLGIACGSLAACRPFFQQCLGTVRRHYGSGYSHSAGERNSAQYGMAVYDPDAANAQAKLVRTSTPLAVDHRYDLKHEFKTHDNIYEQDGEHDNETETSPPGSRIGWASG